MGQAARVVETIRDAWIPLRDGCRLAARVWLPVDALERPVPGIVEYIPYRRGDGTASRDASMHPHFAAAAYAAVRVDMRGSGDSDGVMADEYAPSEQEDGLDVLAWVAEQPWCTGRVGMIGKSWGGFNGLQIAALDPPQLGAVVTVCSTDDRYADDVHYTGGCLLASEMLPWAATMLAWNARPPDPLVVGDGWRDRWLTRLGQRDPYDPAWLAHQRRDGYWRHGSVCEDPSAITAPVLAIGGLADPYRGAVLRLLETLDAPARGLLGPWAHTYPHQASPGPGIDFVGEALAWFDHHLKGKENKVMDRPALRVFLPEGNHAAGSGVDRDGRWVGLAHWPSSEVRVTTWPLTGDNDPGDGDERGAGEALVVLSSTAAVGADAGSWLRFGDPTGDPVDQRGDDARSWTSTLPAQQEPLDVVGMPTVHLVVSVDRPVAQLAARLSDVHPDGTSQLVTAGLWNLTHTGGHDVATDLQPGQRYEVAVPLVATAHRFTPGHRVRVAVSAAYWPWAWPSPDPVNVTIHAGGPARSAGPRVDLPVLHGDGDAPAPRFEPARADPPTTFRVDPDRYERTVTRDHATGQVTVRLRTDSGQFTDDADGRYLLGWSEDRFTLTPSDPLTARVECLREQRVGRGDWHTVVATRSTMTCDSDTFLLTNHLTTRENGRDVFTRTWQHRVPRDHV